MTRDQLFWIGIPLILVAVAILVTFESAAVGSPAALNQKINPPEVLDNVQNVSGVPPSLATSEVESNGQVGNLGLSLREETDLVNFLRILSDE
jgi:hypothetical protein